MSKETAGGQKIQRPLEGIRIVECAVWHAGPGGSAILADLGAEVIKIESLDGDPERRQKNLGAVNFDAVDIEGWSFLFELSNRNKRGICLDIQAPEGQRLFQQLIKTADVFVTNLRKSSKPRLGIDYRSIAAINPTIVHASVSGFGSEGTMSDVGGFDPMGQAISGMMYLTGPDEPVLLQSVVLDQMTAIAASHAILSALFVRERHGIGQEVHVSLYSAAIWLMHSNLLATGILGANPLVAWDRRRNTPLRNCFKCADGKWLMGTNHPEEKFWVRFCQLLQRPELLDDPRYASLEARARHTAELTGLFDEVFVTRPRDEWVRLLQAEGFFFAPVQNIEEVLRDPQARANGYVVDFDHPSLGPIVMPGYPVGFSTLQAGTHGAAPRLGEHTAEVLAELGCNPGEIADLHHRGIIR